MIRSHLLAFVPLLLLAPQAGPTGSTGRSEAISPSRGDRVWVPAGQFVMGSSREEVEFAIGLCSRLSPSPCLRRSFIDEMPRRTVRTSGYFIGLTEVSNAQYEACVRSGACSPRSGHHPDDRFDLPDLPVVDVTHVDARAYCRWRGGRLPTEAEWERAARGPTPRRFPWGNLWNGGLANHGRATIPHHDGSDGYRYLAPVRSFIHGRSPYGLLNMAGNVWEWVADWYNESAYSAASSADPTGPPYGQTRVIRGGSWSTPPFALRVTMRAQAIETDRIIDVGFRCVWEE